MAHKHAALITQWIKNINQPVYVANKASETKWVRDFNPSWDENLEYQLSQMEVQQHPHEMLIHRKLVWPHLKFEQYDWTEDRWEDKFDDLLFFPEIDYRHKWNFTEGDLVKPVDSDTYTIRITAIDTLSFYGRVETSNDHMTARPKEVMQCLNCGFVKV